MRIDYRGNPLLFSFLHVELPWQSIILQLVHLIGYNALSCRIRKLIIKYLEFEVHILINNNEPIVHVVFFFQDDSLQLRKTWRMALGCPREVTVHYTELNTEELSLCCTALTSVSFHDWQVPLWTVVLKGQHSGRPIWALALAFCWGRPQPSNILCPTQTSWSFDNLWYLTNHFSYTQWSRS